MNLLKFILFFSALLVFNWKINMIDFLAEKSVFLNHYCVNTIPLNRRFSEILSALLCGTNLKNPFDKKTFIEMGVYHFIVVSGSHLNLIDKIINTLSFGKIKKTFLFILLFIYCLTTLFQAPVVRAFSVLLLISFNQKSRLFKSNSLLILFCSLLILGLQPVWVRSLSFLLSWSCVLNVLLSGQLTEWLTQFSSDRLHGTIARFFISSGFQMFLYAVLFINPFYLSIPALISYLILTPLLGFIVFPLCLMSFFFLFVFQKNQFSVWFFEFSGQAMLRFFEYFHSWMGSPQFSFKSKDFLWFLFWICYLHGFLYSLEIKNQRTRIMNLAKELA